MKLRGGFDSRPLGVSTLVVGVAVQEISRPRVLIVAYYYPPVSNIGARRLEKFVKYLPTFGFDPIVLAMGQAQGTDDAGRVFRSIDPLLYYRPYRERVLGSGQHYVAIGEAAGLKSRVARFVARDLMIPDPQIGWLVPAVRRAARIIEQQRVDLVFTSSPPVTAHLVGRMIKKRYAVPWVADFRDGWTFDPHPPRPPNAWLRKAIDARLERRVVEECDAVVCATRRFTEDFKSRFGKAPGRIVTIMNGYDDDDYKHIESVEPDPGVFLIVHTGGFASSKSTRTPYHFLRALRRFLTQLDAERRKGVRVVFAGRLTESETAMVTTENLAGVVSCPGNLAYHQALELQLKASVLLLVTTPDETSEATGTLFEDRRARRPILALADSNVAAEIILDLNAGICVRPTDVDRICDALTKLFGAHESGTLRNETPHSSLIAYSRQAACELLQSTFRNVLTDGT